VFKRLGGSLLVLLAIGGLVAACGDDDDGTVGGGGSTTTTTAPEDVRASDADVADGLATIDGLGKDIVAAVQGGDTAGAEDLLSQIEPAWQRIEGTIKANDEDTYLTFEDSFAAIGLAVDGKDAAKASEASTAISTAVAAYLKAHPA
jgi:hypothetical protein